MISQFSQESLSIPPGQPDRSRTPRRPQQDGHQQIPAFRGPLHYAMTSTRPFIPPIGVPPPPPPTWLNPPRPTWMDTSSGQPFPPTPPSFPQTTQDYNVRTPQRHTITPRSPPSSTSPIGNLSVQHGYIGRPIDIPPVEQWKPDVDFHDTTKVNGLGFPSKIRQSRFSSYKDIEGMDPLQVPLWKFLCQGIHNTWLRRIAYGRETFVIPFDNIGTTVFIAELVAQLRSRNVDLDKLATYTSLALRDNLSTRKRLHKPWPRRSPSARASQGQASASTSFDPATLLVISPGSVNPWLVDNQPTSLTETQYKKWLKDLKLPQHKLETLEKQMEKITE